MSDAWLPGVYLLLPPRLPVSSLWMLKTGGLPLKAKKVFQDQTQKMYQHLSTKTWDKGKARLCDIRFVWEVLSGILCTLRPRLSGYHVWYLLINVHRALNHSIEDQDCTLQCLWTQGEGCVTWHLLATVYKPTVPCMITIELSDI